jgi:hypothetical protein
MATLGNFTAAILTAAELNAIGTWTTWTPTWSNLTVGNGTVVARYSQINKVIHMRANLVWGSTTSISGNVTFALPVTASSTVSTTGHGVAQFGDTSSAQFLGVVRLASTTTAQLVVPQTSGNYPNFVQLSSTVPFTWVNTDTIDITLTYEAA